MKNKIKFYLAAALAAAVADAPAAGNVAAECEEGYAKIYLEYARAYQDLRTRLENAEFAKEYPFDLEWRYKRAALDDAELENMVNAYVSHAAYPRAPLEAEHRRVFAACSEAAEAGGIVARRNVGSMLLYGIGVAPDKEAAFSQYLVAAEAGDVFATGAVAGMYFSAEGTEKDNDKGAEYARRAADAGDAYGQYVLAVAYETGLGVEMDLAQSNAWAKKAAEQGLASGELVLARNFFAEGDREAGLQWMTAAAEKGVTWAMSNFSWWYQHEAPGFLPGDKEALRWQRPLARRGSATEQRILGAYYYDGNLGLEQDRATARKWYRLAAMQQLEIEKAGEKAGSEFYPGSNDVKAYPSGVWAQHMLGRMYVRGEGGAADAEEGKKWLAAAARRGYIPAQYDLGAAAPAEAEQWWRTVLATDLDSYEEEWGVGARRGAARYIARAGYELGKMYGEGRGEKDGFAADWEVLSLSADARRGYKDATMRRLRGLFGGEQ